MGKIARIIGGISKTTVHNIIHDWNIRISAGNIEDIRFFMRTLRESGITIENCIEGFRIQQMLKEFGISEEPYDWIIEEDAFTDSPSCGGGDGSGNYTLHNSYESKADPEEKSLLDVINQGKETSQTKGWKNDKIFNKSRLDLNPVSCFVQILYKECKTHRLAPAIVIKWIRDMLDFFPVVTSNLYSTSNEQLLSDIPEYVNDECYGDSSQEKDTSDKRHASFPNVQMDPSANAIDVPLVSKIPFFIDQKKAEINKLLHIEKKIKDKIQEANEHKIKIELEVHTLVKKHKEIFRYFRWHKNLGQELAAKYNIKLDNEIETFYKAINDFKHTTMTLGR